MSAPREGEPAARGPEVEDQLLELTRRFEQVLEISPTAIVFTDLDNRIASWNPAAERLFGYSAEEAAGRDLDDLVASTDALHAEAVQFRQRVAASEHVQTISRRTRKDGSIVDVELLAAPLVVDGEPVGTFAIYHDITELNRQRRFFEALLEVSPEAIVTTNLNDIVTSWNPAAERLFGYAAAEAIGKDIDDLVSRRPDLRAEGKEINRGSMSAPTEHFVTQRTRKDGSLVDVDVVGGPVDVGGELVAKHVFYHDISELQEQKRYFESLLEISPTAIVVTNLESRVVSWNPGAERLFGYSATEAVGGLLDDLVATRPDLYEEAVRISEAAERGERVNATARRTRKDGSLVDVQMVSAPVVVSEERVGYLVVYHDVSELQEQRRYFESLLEISPTAIVITDLDSTIVSWNPGAERLFGYMSEDAVGRVLDDLVATAPELRDEALSITQAAGRGEQVQAITRRTRSDGSLVDVELLIAPVTVGGEQVGFYIIYHDITEVQRQKRWLESVLTLSPTAIITVDQDTRVTSWNPGAERLFGYTAEEAVGAHLDQLVANAPEIREEAARYSAQSIGDQQVRVVTRRARKDGSLVDVEMLIAEVLVGDERVGHSVIYHDIGEIQRQKRYYEALVQWSPNAIVLMDPQGTVTSWNPAAERLFDYAAEEAIGRHIDDLIATDASVRVEAESGTERGMSGELVHLITKRTRKDGTLVDVELFGAPVVVGGEAVGLYGLYHDIGELQRAREEAEAATEAKSAFLATMSHEIRTPLNAVIGMTGLLLDTELAAEQRHFAEVIRGSGDALLGVINDILDFSKIEAGRLELEATALDLRGCIESALELVAPAAAQKGLDLAYDLDPEAPTGVVGDLTRLRQILINLLNNAVKFTELGEVVVTVRAEPIETDDRHRLTFAVRDTGIGIGEERRDRLFESFSQVDPSTTRRYGGTGLGLAISNRLVELMGGTMSVESSPGEGSIFRFTIEADAAPLPPRAFERAVASLRGKRVLIVDDNATNRDILTRQATIWGMDARQTGSPVEALGWIRGGELFDVVILDQQMPEMDGLTLAEEIGRVRADLPLVMLTSIDSIDASSAAALAGYLTKPVKPSQLFDALMGLFGVGFAESAERVAVVAEPDEHLAERLPLRILVVEDNAVNQQLALLLLQKVGYRADVAANGVEALEALQRQRYDVVLMDVEMPEMDGLEATRQIRRMAAVGPRPRIIAVTAKALQGERELCLQAGMDDYLTKPIRLHELIEALLRGGPSTDVPAAPAVDPDVLRRFITSLGTRGRESAVSLIDTFLDHGPAQLASLRQALEQHETDEARREAHTLKSNAAAFGATALEAMCRELESAAEADALHRGADLVPRITSELERVTRELERIREELDR
jgi:PAS domain S-box-containing protein